jgi:hypothetical protein
MMASPASLVIGVTGHRKLADRRELAAKIDAILDEIAGRASGERVAEPGSTGDQATQLRLVVLSPLAEGADRLVAKRVLAREGAELEAVLPMDEDDYEADFTDPASRAEFRSLLARARTIHRLPRASNREEAYAAVGRYVVDHCDVLAALWDGKPSEGPGGTADVVRYARQARRLIFQIEPDSDAMISRPPAGSGKGPT